MGLVSKPNTFTAGATIVASEHNSNFDTLYALVNGNIENANIKSNAGIVGSKLNLSAPGAIGGTTPGTGAFTTLSASGAATFNGDVTIGNATGDALTFHPGAWTLTNGVTITGTWVNLGAVTTVDINGGTLDGVQVGGTTATGELLVNNASDQADGLGSQGTSGQFLKSAGAGANPTWADGTVYVAGTLAECTAATERNTNSGTYAKLKELSPLIRGGTVTVNWDYKTSDAGYIAYTKVYVGGVATGDEKTHTGDTDYTNVSQATLTVAAGDVIQIYAKTNNTGASCYVKNLKLLVTRPSVPQEISSY